MTGLNELPPAALRVRDAAASRGLAIEIVVMAQTTRTAAEAAAACGCSVAEIVKSLVFRGAETGAGYLLLVSGENRVDEQAAGARIGEALERPDAAFVRDVTGFAIGGVAPLGHASPLETFMDEDLLAFDTVWAAAGTPSAVFPVAPLLLRDAAAAKVIRMRA